MHFPNEEIAAGRPVRVTPLHERYAAMGAHFGMTDGWERPNWFAGEGREPVETPTFRRSEAHDAVARECAHVQSAAGYTDLITYANYLITGPDAAAFLHRVLPGKLPKADGRLALMPLIEENAGTLGDVTVLRLDAETYMMVGSGSLSRIHMRTILPHADRFDMTFENRTESWGGFSVAGDRKSTRLNSSHSQQSRMPSSA